VSKSYNVADHFEPICPPHLRKHKMIGSYLVRQCIKLDVLQALFELLHPWTYW
jgi:hypothetical protein